MFNLLEWWRTRRKPLPPGALMDRVAKLDAAEDARQTRPTLRQYALSQLDKDGRNKSNGKGK
jgi:hypothetical protein